MSTDDLTSGQKGRVTKLLNELKDDYSLLTQEIRAFQKEVFQDDDGKKSIKTVINESFAEIQKKAEETSKKYDEINNFYSELLETDDENQSIKDAVEEMKVSTEEILKELSEKKSDFDTYYSKIFGDEDENGKRSGGLQQEVDRHKNDLGNLKTQKEAEYNALFKKIEGLLPGATSIGLAEAYQRQKQQYYAPNIWWSVIFIATMIGMMLYAYETIPADMKFSQALSKTLIKIPFLVPAVWLGIFASKQQSQNKRLAQEYAFKETSARSYEGYRKQIESLGQSKEAKNVLITLAQNLVKISGENPSSTLDSKSHKDDPPLLNRLMNIFPNNASEKSESESK